MLDCKEDGVLLSISIPKENLIGFPPVVGTRAIEHVEEGAVSLTGVGLSDLVSTTNETVSSILNIMGVAEKNLKSYKNIKEANRETRLVKELERILEYFVDIRQANRITLWYLAEFIEDENPRFQNVIDDRSLQLDLTRFLGVLAKIGAILQEYQGDLISLDFKLFETLQDAINGRTGMISIIIDRELRDIDRDTLMELLRCYQSIVKITEEAKVALSAHINQLRSGKS